MPDVSTQAPPRTRPVRDDDAPALIALVGGVYAEYEGCVLDLDGIDDDLVAPATSFRRSGARLWVVDGDDQGLAATIGLGSVTPDGTTELKRLYVAPTARRQGIGQQLVRWVEDVARRSGSRRMELWSDTRFEDAHRLYQRLGYQDTGRRRELHDPSHTTERHFERLV